MKIMNCFKNRNINHRLYQHENFFVQETGGRLFRVQFAEKIVPYFPDYEPLLFSHAFYDFSVNFYSPTGFVSVHFDNFAKT